MPAEPESFKARLQQRRAAWTDEEDSLPIPGYGGELVARYRDTSWSEFRAVAMSAAMSALGNAVPAGKEVEQAVTMLLEANVGLEAHVDGRVAEIEDETGVPVKLGLGLARFLGVDMADVDTDRQAMHLVFHRDKDLMTHAMALVSAQEARSERADGELAKN
jgi:hypothetical protein